MRKLSVALCGALLAGLAACKDPLVVENQNNAHINRALGTPTDLEKFIGATYNTVHAGTLAGGNDGLFAQVLTMSLENVSGLANFAMGPRGQIPRNPIDNTPNAQGDAGNLRDWTVEHRAARMATMGLARLKTLTLGSAARDARARAFAYFSLGAALGNLAMAYDSGAHFRQMGNEVHRRSHGAIAQVWRGSVAPGQLCPSPARLEFRRIPAVRERDFSGAVRPRRNW